VTTGPDDHHDGQQYQRVSMSGHAYCVRSWCAEATSVGGLLLALHPLPAMLNQLRHRHAARAFRSNDLTRWKPRTSHARLADRHRQTHPRSATASADVAGASRLQWSSYVSRRINLDLAVEEAVEEVLKDFQPDTPATVAVVFLSSAFVGEYDQVVAELRKRLPSLKVVWGSTVSASRQQQVCCGCCSCTHPPCVSQGYGVIGTTAEGPEEIEHAPALSLTLGYLPGVDLRVTRVTASNLPDGGEAPQGGCRRRMHSTKILQQFGD
jgi:hypothetical protein